MRRETAPARRLAALVVAAVLGLMLSLHGHDGHHATAQLAAPSATVHTDVTHAHPAEPAPEGTDGTSQLLLMIGGCLAAAVVVLGLALAAGRRGGARWLPLVVRLTAALRPAVAPPHPPPLTYRLGVIRV